MFTSKELRGIARDKLKGNWGMALLASFIASFFLGAHGSGIVFNMEEYVSLFHGFSLDPAIIAAIESALVIALVLSIVLFLIGSAVELGHNLFYINLILRNDHGGVGTVFSRFGIFGKALLLRLLIFAKVFLWSMLFVIPGIVASYRYALAPYIMAEDPSIGVVEAVERSKQLMAGHKMRLFMLGLSFIGWALLAGLTFGIGGLWLNPYIYTANAAFYVERTGRSIPFPNRGNS